MGQLRFRFAAFLVVLAGCNGSGHVGTPPEPDAGTDPATDAGTSIDASRPGIDATIPPETDGGVPPVEPDSWYLTAMANYRVVSAGATGADALAASQTTARASEELEIVENANGTISLRAVVNGLYVEVDANARLVARGAEVSPASQFRRFPQDNGGIALQSVTNDRYVSADLNEGAALIADRMEVAGWEIFFLHPMGPPATETPDFGPNVLAFDPSMSAADIQSRVNRIFDEMEDNQFGDSRYAFLFAPGTYDVDVNVGYYTHVIGLGASPDEVTIRGAVRAEADWFDGNATQNFWRGAENFAIEPAGGTNRWAVSQAAALRRVHVRGGLVLDDGGWSSGGFLADSLIDGQVASGSQQQWLTRNTQMGSWTGRNWNMVFVGVVNAPAGANNYPNPPYTVVDESPVLREKPFLVRDALGHYSVFVPALRTNTRGTSWQTGSAAGTSIPLSEFHIAREGVDTAATINAALAAGRHLLVTPGIYHLSEPIRVTRANTVVLGLGLATFIPDGGSIAMTIADVDGVKIAGILFDAGEVSSPILLQVGPPGSSADHSANPTSLHDVYFRVGGAAVGRAEVSVEVNSDDVIGDHFWVWRGDHTYGIGWDLNTGATGLIVNGDDVTMYGLFVEHYQRYQTIWNGERGRTYFYQNEIPYDVPNQASWMNGGVRGFAAYKVADGVTTHEAWGLGSYCFFSSNPSVVLERSFEVPNTPGVRFHHMVSVSLGGTGTIAHVINGTGGAASPSNNVSYVVQYP
ncbi:hypothetical protein [Sandaracinus amylolyticus]|uniref:hypothetical protein n=1 Tax=Sandaracinus amylolyticus TaxID=927083 RepID=UPI001F1EABF5|nr:hypothetical protein [Sandaracinus amylolyticus]UJR83137.1 Hypothetical protein I5071_52030 [Sandaracinus amylolyticus]